MPDLTGTHFHPGCPELVKDQSSISGCFPPAPLNLGPCKPGGKEDVLDRHFGTGWEGIRALPAPGSALPVLTGGVGVGP